MKYLVFAVAIFVTSLSGYSQSKFVEYSGDVLHLALPGAAFVSTLIWSEENYSGAKEFIWAAGVSTVVTYALKFAINKERPNGEGHAFPSGHTYRAFMGAEFIRRKFGWEAGVPAYILAGYTGYTRVYANKHDYWDILGGATVGIVSSYIFAKPYFNNQKISMGFGREYDSFVLNLQMSF
jgi:membrane-associated phospholipid phosphatase